MERDKETGIPLTKRQGNAPWLRPVLFWVGVLLVVVSPLVGVIPGPGGVVFFAAGAGLMLKNSRWAKRQYARFKRRHPNKGAWADWSMRRPSQRRRAERDKAAAAAEPAQDR